MKEENTVENKKNGTNMESLPNMEPADCEVGFLHKHHINDALTFKTDGTDMFVPVINGDGKVLRLARVNEDGNLGEYETLDESEALLVGRKTPSYAVTDLASACIVAKYGKMSAVVYRDAYNLRNIVERFPEMKIVGVDSDFLEEYGGRSININAFEAKHNLKLHKRDFRTLEGFYLAGGDIYSLLGIMPPKIVIDQVGRSINCWKPRKWIIQNLLPASPSINMLYGPSGTAKTYFVLDWGLTLASGLGDWHGLKTKKSSFLYMCGEGFDAVAPRVRLWFQEKRLLDKIDDVPFYIMNSAIKFNEQKDYDAFQESLDFYFNMLKPEVVAIDTLNLFMSGEENSVQDATNFIRALKTFAIDNMCTILLIHHTGVMTQDRARGSSAFFGAMDTVSAVSENASGNIILKQQKNRNKKIMTGIAFELEEHKIADWIDLDTDEEMTDCILKKISGDGDGIVGIYSMKPEEKFLLEVCANKNAKRENWKKISRNELIEYAEKSDIYKDSKTSVKTLMNQKQKGRPLYKLLERGILKNDENSGPENYVVADVGFMIAVNSLIGEESDAEDNDDLDDVVEDDSDKTD